MKKLILSLVCVCAIGMFAANAQVCTPIDTFSEAGLYPAPDELPCLDKDSAVDVTIYFKNFDTVSSLTITSLRIDSITNMPCGVSYKLNQADRTYNGGETGCVAVTGIASDVPGQYKLGIYVTITANGLPTPISGEAGALAAQFGAADFSYYVRVFETGTVCPDVDTASTAVNVTAACPTVDLTGVGIKEISNVSNFQLFPNPATNQASVKFVAETAGTYSASIVNLVGQQVAASTLVVAPGANTHSFDVSSLPSGIYMFTLTDGKSTFTSRFAVNN